MIMERTMGNGIRVMMEQMQGVRSVALGVWVNAGSVRESKAEAGASHFIEHMVFKGTERRSAADIAAEMDNVGGTLNAFTSKECTCFYAKVLDEHLSIAADVLADLVFHSTFDAEELEKERRVVLEEILMTEDSPEDVSAETAGALFFQGDPLALPILGTKESIGAMSRETLLSYKQAHYVPKNIVIACAGSFSPDKLMELLERHFSIPESPLSAGPFVQGYPGGRRVQFVKKDIEQIHLTLALPGFARDSEGQYPLAVLSNIIGGSMSSRLFQRIREERGLAYTVYSYPLFYANTGAFALYAGTGEQQAAEVVRLMRKELAEIRENGVTEEEFLRCREQLKGSYLLSMESSNAHMSALGKVALLQNREYNEAETIRRIECVTMEDIQRILPTVLDESNLSAAFVGRVERQRTAIEAALEE